MSPSPHNRNRAGLTLAELLVSIVLVSILAGGLYQVFSAAMVAYTDSGTKQAQIQKAGRAIEGMTMFAQETDFILSPTSATPTNVLQVGERVLDTYNNATDTYAIDGDGLLDADVDADGLVNEHAVSSIRYYLVPVATGATGTTNWTLMEECPSYAAGTLGVYRTNTLCDGVTQFSCSLLATNLVEIALTVSDGKTTTSLKTRARARLLQP